MNRQQARSRINALLEEAHNVGLEEIERSAREVMRRHPHITTFCMAMGSAAFYDATGPLDHDSPYLSSFYDFVYEFDEYLKLTGSPMKIQGADGTTQFDW